MAKEQPYGDNYIVKVKKAAIKQGKKLAITNKQRLEIIGDLKLLKHWSENAENYDFENAFGAIEFKYNLPGKKWVRVMVYQDEVRKIMWVMKVFNKKTNSISKVHQIGIETAVSQVKNDIRKYEKKQKNREAKSKLSVVTGGKVNE